MRPMGPYELDEVAHPDGPRKRLRCSGCGMDDRFEVRRARIAAGFLWEPLRNLEQVHCWNCDAVHWFRRNPARRR